MKLHLPRKWRRQTPVFLIGMGLFALGVLGFVFEAWQTRVNQLDQLLSNEVVFVAQASTDKLEGLQNQNLNYFIPSWLSEAEIENKYLARWLGKEVALIAIDDKHFILGARHRHRSALKTWLQTQLLPGEQFTITKTDQGEVWTPGFSSQQAFLIMDRWVFAGDSLETLQKAFSTERPSLASSDRYQRAFAGVPDSREWRLFIDLENYLMDWKPAPNLAVYQPLITAFGQAIPTLGLTAKSIDESILKLNAQFQLAMTQPADTLTPALKNTTIPDLAHFAPNQVMFFLNGQELYGRYQHTKNFLKELNPQFELIFDGLIRAQVERWLGETADLEKDLLAKIQGPYAIMLDYNEGIDWLFITESQVGETLENQIRTAQGRFAPKVETVELPDGTIREELVAAPPEAIKINEVTHQGWTYSVTQSASLNQGELAFLQQGKYFLIASNRDLLESALEAKKSDTASLANNNDFRQAVLYRLGQAESFGFINVNKLKKAIEPLSETPLESSEDEAEAAFAWWQEILRLPLRNIIFSRRVEAESVMVNWLLFGN